MKVFLSLACMLFCFACSEQPAADPEPAETALPCDTLTAVDSIGVLMGDSSYVLGVIADYTTISGGQPAILDRLKCSISVFNPDGTFQFSAGRTGEGPGEFQYPFHMTRLSSGVFIVVELMGEVTALDETGEYLSGWTYPGRGAMPIDCIPFDDSTFVGYFFSMKFEDTSISIEYSLRRYSALTGNVTAEYFSWIGDPAPSTDFTPAYLVAAADGNGNLYVSHIENEQWLIEVYGSQPEPVDSIILFPERERVALPDSGGFVPGCIAVRYGFEENGEMLQEMVNMPEEHPFISELGVDCDGNIWCRRGGVPGNLWDVVSPDGEHLREVFVSLPDSAYFIDMDISPHGILAFDMFTEDYHKLYIME